MISNLILYIYHRLSILTEYNLIPCSSQSSHCKALCLMQAVANMILTKKWIWTRHVTMLIKALCQTGTQMMEEDKEVSLVYISTF